MSVIVLGMHRSGTSAVTRSLNLLGLSVGRVADLLPANEENPRGFWENTHLTEFNDELLATLGGSWSEPPLLEDRWWEDSRLAVHRERARTLVAEVLGGGAWCWKDPRLCLTLPFWRSLLSEPPRIVLVRRHPFEIHESLATRNGMEKRGALSLWGLYMRSALVSAEGLPVCPLDYARLLENPGAALDPVMRFLERQGVTGLEMPPETALESFLNRDLRHWSAPDDVLDADPEVDPEERRLWETLRALSATDALAPQTLPDQPYVARAHLHVQRDQLRLVRAELSAASDRLERCENQLGETRDLSHAYDTRIVERLDEVLGQLEPRPGVSLPAGALDEDAAADAPVDVLVPIYNAYDHVKRCIDSVLAWTDPKHRVILLDDASTDPRILPLLDSYGSEHPQVEVVRSSQNLGFVGNVNRGFDLTRGDVVILNSDTEVTPGWLERLVRCARSEPAIGVVSPLSNNATILSVPIMNEANVLPEGVSAAEFAALVERCSSRSYPRIPTAVGFCMLITREALDTLGRFDEAFNRGYGEECDFCMRAWSAGFEVACCDDAYVHHHGEASFAALGPTGLERQRNDQILHLFWPEYHRAVMAFCHLNPLREIQERLYTALRRRRAGSSRPHVLQVIHSFGTPGGTELHTAGIVGGLAERYLATIVHPTTQPGVWTDMVTEEPEEHLRVVRLGRENVAAGEYFAGLAGDLEKLTVEMNFARLVAGGDHDLVHFQHLGGWGTLQLPMIAKALGKRVIVSLHDYFLLCPEYNLVRPEMTRCGKAMADERAEDCFSCLAAKRLVRTGRTASGLHDYLTRRSQALRRIVAATDVFVAPSRCVRDQFVRAFGEGMGTKIRVIPHGVAVAGAGPRPPRGDRLRVGFLGNLSDRKGGLVLLETARRLAGEPISFELFGGASGPLAAAAQEAGMILHGSYRSWELPDLLAEIDLVVIPSVWDESFCLTVSEAQAMGVPVLASAVGAIPERIEDGRTGFLVPPGDPVALATRLRALAADHRSLAPVIDALSGLRVKTIEENVEDYAGLYDEVLATRAATATASAAVVRMLLGMREPARPAPSLPAAV